MGLELTTYDIFTVVNKIRIESLKISFRLLGAPLVIEIISKVNHEFLAFVTLFLEGLAPLSYVLYTFQGSP